MSDKEDDDGSLIAKIIAIVGVFVIFVLLGCVVCMVHSYSNRSRLDMCQITEVVEHRDNNGVTIMKTAIYFVPIDERPYFSSII